MNLMTFAVMRKLNHGDPLLEYISQGKPVPTDVLEASLNDLIAPLEDARSSYLISDYVGMLQAYVPTTSQRDPVTGKITIAGEIPDDILESIEWVHRVASQDAISNMIEHTVSNLVNQESTITSLDLSELETAIQTMNAAIPSVEPVVNIQEDLAVNHDLKEKITHEIEAMNQAVEAKVEEPSQEVVIQPTVVVEEPSVIEDRVEDMVEDRVEEFIPVEEFTPVEETDLIEEFIPVEDVDTAEDDLKASMRRVYGKVVDDIKSAGLDKKLNLSHAI